MSINALLNEIETQFTPVLNSAKTCRQFQGPFTPVAIMQHSFNAPGVFVGCSGFAEARQEDMRLLDQYGPVQSAAFTAITVGKHAKSLVHANAEAMLLAQQIAAQLYRQNFGLDYVANAYNVRAQALATGRLEKQQLCFWRVTWSHGVALNQDALAELDVFEGYDADHFEADADTDTAQPKMTTQENY